VDEHAIILVEAPTAPRFVMVVVAYQSQCAAPGEDCKGMLVSMHVAKCLDHGWSWSGERDPSTDMEERRANLRDTAGVEACLVDGSGDHCWRRAC
jgi:hypothetical protein